MSESRFDLKRALLVSALLHVLLLLSPVLSWDWGRQPEPPAETVLNFDLTPAGPEPEPEPLPEPAPEEQPPQQALEAPAPPAPQPPTVEPRGGPEEGEDAEYRTPVPGFDEPAPSEAAAAPAPEQRPAAGTDRPSSLDSPGAGALPLGEDDPGRPEPDPGDALEARPGADEPLDLDEAIESLDRAIEDLAVPRPSEPPIEPPEEPGALELPDSMSFSAQGFQFGGAEIRWESGDPRLLSYARQMLIYLNKVYKRRQYLDRGRFERWAYNNDNWFAAAQPVVFHFTVTRSGEIVDLSFEDSSRLQPLDDVMRDTMMEAVLQPLPPDFPLERERFTLIATGGRIDIREYVRYLAALHRAGRLD